MKKIVLGIALTVSVIAMLCGVSYAGSNEECAPCAKFSKCVGEEFLFDGTRSCGELFGTCPAQLCFTWDFGDGTTAEGPCVKHCYANPGEYTVKLTVTDNSGLTCSTDVITQVVKVNCPPVAIFTGPDCACCGVEVTYDASQSYSKSTNNLNYHWNFGDGTCAEGKVVKHTFTCGGCKKVTLTVDDGSCSACCTDVACMDVRVNSAPCADAGCDVCMTCVPQGQDFEVCFKGSGSDPEGDCLTYMWNFGDGTSAEGACVTHVYANPGVYKATLMVSDGCNSPCSTASDAINVTLSRQPCADAGQDYKVCAGTAVELNGSKSVAGPAATYAWDFGDCETGNGMVVNHTYAKGGNYVATLTVTDGECVACDTACIEVNQAPTATLCGPSEACTGENISFDACASCDPDGDCLTFNWDFGDGCKLPNGGPKVCHMYEKGGAYTVIVDIDDGKGMPCSVDNESTRITINGRPIAVIGPCDACCVGKEILFDASGSSDPDGDALTYSWDFGDGTSAEGVKVTHTYNKAGSYQVTLKVDDGKGTPCSVNYAMYTSCIHQGPKADICVN